MRRIFAVYAGIALIFPHATRHGKAAISQQSVHKSSSQRYRPSAKSFFPAINV
ncbi:hypothetical protein KCP74_19595 [Salmonella enterica subsp. enterica]|nr:hypothetical protein KCP74_19595 [Salmonella enterica subsp. enterica]